MNAKKDTLLRLNRELQVELLESLGRHDEAAKLEPIDDVIARLHAKKAAREAPPAPKVPAPREAAPSEEATLHGDWLILPATDIDLNDPKVRVRGYLVDAHSREPLSNDLIEEADLDAPTQSRAS